MIGNSGAKRVLVVSAHPDDEVVGAGGAIARHVAAGDSVFWCVATKAYAPQWAEEAIVRADQQVEAVRAFLGIQEVFRLGFPTVKLNTVAEIDLTSALQSVVDRVRPEIVYTTPGRDINRDHRIVYEATLVATRPLPGLSVRRVLSYEIGTTGRYWPEPFRPTVFVDISAYLEKKLEAMALYETEVRTFPHPRSLEGLRLIAQERGLSAGLPGAEAFELVREIV